MLIEQVFENLWQQYIKISPQAEKIHSLLSTPGRPLINDHVAFRTFDHPKVNIEVLAQPFLDLGYEEGGTYEFPVKKLFAKHFEHSDKNLPKVFISQLITSEFSQFFNQKVRTIVDSISPAALTMPHFLWSGRTWEISYGDYQKLEKESPYGAWLSAFGYCANHFTVLVNTLDTYRGLPALNEFLKAQGFTLNDSGGEIKGSPQELLEQSSTMAARIAWDFNGEIHQVPSCYYEFAKRYPTKSGELYQGFVSASADKIFESTDQKKSK